MEDIAKILRLVAEDIKESGLPKPTTEIDGFFVRLLRVAAQEIDALRGTHGGHPARNDIVRLQDHLNRLKTRTEMGAGFIGTVAPFDVGGSGKALSQKMFNAAKSLSRGDVDAWMDLCHHAEEVFKARGGRQRSAAYKQTKSNIKRMLKAGMDLMEFETESSARRALLTQKTPASRDIQR